MMKKAILPLVSSLLTLLLAVACTARPSESMSRGAPRVAAQSPSELSSELRAEPVRQIDAAFMREYVYDYRESPDEFVFKGLHPAVILFYADGDEDSTNLMPKVEAIAKRYASKIDVYKVDVTREEELADLYGLRTSSTGYRSQGSDRLGVQSIPMLLFVPLEGFPQQVVGDLSLDYIERAIAEVYRED